MGINVFINYYHPASTRRAAEIDACYTQWMHNGSVDKRIVLAEPAASPPQSPDRAINASARPLVREYFDAVNAVSSADDVNIVSNSDCFLAEDDTLKVAAISHDIAYCLSRIEIKSIDPLRRFWWRNRYLQRKHATDSQDCWVIRGRPRQGMMLEFPLGMPGCDNRLAHELQQAGYCIVNPAPRLKLYHFHRCQNQTFRETDRIPGPYAFPKNL